MRRPTQRKYAAKAACGARGVQGRGAHFLHETRHEIRQ